ncbi:hypothetical protein HXX76_004785 [Chlamydomonas incerta]|uniref:Uncharacterized protein n=1 Tax=Chlamydomonas incerta TaxID=51695 RepID=A0A835TFK5_CHLIN|nr:hypothetical protein HXX76_004785 [Chlamydomonas incerta]|eukprot:KAG2439429.1 hypothetical protein HXX76_004785 [Chlamydomonas incerta]
MLLPGRRHWLVASADVPRAYQAVDSKHPDGSKGLSIPTYTVLQQHAAFWDRDNDGRIYPYDTYVGCREIGMSLPLSLAFMALLHFTLLAPYMTQDSWLLHPYLAIHLKNIHRLHHASDTGTYDEEGRMYPRKFEEIWEVLGAEQLSSWADVRRLLAANRCVGDPLGWLASAVSWGLLYGVARDERGVLGREAVRRCFDGTLFYALAEGRRARALASKYE